MKKLMIEDTPIHQKLRKELVEGIRRKGIRDERLLDVLGRVPRQAFVDAAHLSPEAIYQDNALPIEEGQTISQPYTVAFQTELLKLRKGERVLEVGTGSGYQACVLLEMGADLYTIEYNKKLHEKSKRLLEQMGYQADFILGDGSLGWSAGAPYDKILVTAGAPHIPDSLLYQLKEGGILVIPVGNSVQQQMYSVRKLADDIEIEKLDYFRFVPLLGRDGWR